MPLFSVVIPTLNRAHRLKDALQSVLAQDFEDYEIIVSDNCSSDDTRGVATSFADERIHYVRPDKYLRMHDHWEFARKQARGDYLIFLGDDDCLLKNALSVLAGVLKSTDAPIVGCKNVDYYSTDYWVAKQRNHILIKPFSGELISIDTHAALQECFRFNVQYFPRVTVPIARSLVESIANQVGRFFDYPYPEYVGFAMAFSMIDRYPFLDRPLVVLGRTSDSLGPRYFWSNQDPSWKETTGQPFVFVPLKGTFVTNGAAESFLRAKNYLPERFDGIDMSLVDYLKNHYADMLTQRWLGRDVQDDLDEFYAFVDSLDATKRAQVQDSIKGIDLHKPKVSRLLQRARTLGMPKVKTLISGGNKNTGGERWIDGRDVGVSDIMSCVEWLNGQGDVALVGNV